MLEDLADLFEQGAADGTPIRDIVGDDPTEFVTAFVENYKGRTWKTGKKQKLATAIDRAVAEQARAGAAGTTAGTTAGTGESQAADPGEDEPGGTGRQRWRAYRARVKRLPEPYRQAIEAVQRYSYYSGLTAGLESGTGIQAMLDDMIDLFEQAAADGTPIRDIVSDDPADFVDTFVQNYKGPKDRSWETGKQEELSDAINRAAGADSDAGADPEPDDQ
jgi:DNA-binding ferritin-like protein (Dps family)